MLKNQIKSSQQGAIALIALMGIMVFSLIVLTTTSVLATSAVQMSSAQSDTAKTFYAAEAGINEGLYRLTKNPGALSFSLIQNEATTQVDIIIDPTDPLGKKRRITSIANFQNKIRTLSVKANTNALAADVQHAVQSGEGGIEMENNSEIRGNMYANGPISGDHSIIIGDVWSSGSAGSVDGPTVGSPNPSVPTIKCPTPPPDPKYNDHKISAHSLKNITVYGGGGDPDHGGAHYQNVMGTVKSIVGANTDACTEGENGPNCFDNASDPLPTQYPFTQQQIDEFKNIADDNTLPPGNVTINSDTTLSARKIVGNLTVTGGTLTLDGPVWVTGTIDVNHPNVTIRLPSSANEASGVLITDQSIDIKNNALLQGSGNSKSFLIIMALKNDVSNWVVHGANNSLAVIYFAPNGLIQVSQNAQLNNTTGKKILLENNSCIQYDPNLAYLFIPGGPLEVISVVNKSWQEI